MGHNSLRFHKHFSNWKTNMQKLEMQEGPPFCWKMLKEMELPLGFPSEGVALAAFVSFSNQQNQKVCVKFS